MSVRTLSDDGLVTVLLCSRLGLPRSMPERSLDIREWNHLVRAVVRSPWERPRKLLGQSAEVMHETLGIEPTLAERVAHLLDRGVQVASELERFAARGIWAVTRADEEYPRRLTERLRDRRPPVLFGAGPIDLLAHGGLAVVGSRNVDERGAAFAAKLGRLAARSGMVVVSGAARGVDRVAMMSAIESGGRAAGILADGLERWLRDAEVRHAVHDERLVLASQFKPDAGFDVGNAMARNRLIYCIADHAVVVAATEAKGGTWTGAIEDLRHEWVPLFVRTGAGTPSGNGQLLVRGGIPLDESQIEEIDELSAWLVERSRRHYALVFRDRTVDDDNRDRATAEPTPIADGDEVGRRVAQATFLG